MSFPDQAKEFEMSNSRLVREIEGRRDGEIGSLSIAESLCPYVPLSLGRSLAILVGIFLVSLSAVGGQPSVLEDPLPIKRVLIPASRVPAELEKVRQGVLISMPRPDFEDKIQKAARAAQARKNPPRLVKAEYRAVLDGSSLTNGRGEWTVLNPGPEAGILPLGELNLALEKVKTKEDAEAVIGNLDGKNLGLLIEKGGSQPIYFDWTLRGKAGNDGLQFELKVPPCAVNFLELTVPVDHLVAVSSSWATLSGPHESEVPNQRKWRLHFAGRSQIDLAIRKKNGPGATPLVLSQLQGRQQLNAGRCLADFDFHLEVLHGSAEQFLFACDPGLEPYEVTSRNADIKSWELQKSKQPGKTLAVQLREPIQGVLAGLQVRCLAPVQGEGPWTSPGLHLLNGMERGETLKLTPEPGVRLENWQAGRFRLITTSSEKDGAQSLTLLDSGGEKKARPGGTIKFRGVDFLAKQKTWWQIGPNGSTLTADIDLEINRGKLFQLSLLLPTGTPGWNVENVAMDPAESMGTWVASGNLLAIDLHRGLVAGTKGTFRVRLSSAAGRKVPAHGQFLDFPDIRIVEPCLRSGVLAISVRAPYQAVVNASLAAGPESSGPWKSSLPQFYYPFRNEAVAGKLRLLPYRPKVQARCSSEVVLGPGGAALNARLDLEPVQGNPTALDLYLSAPLPKGWQWKTEDNQFVKRERLPLAETLPSLLALGARQPLEWATLQTLLPRGQRWRLTLAKPLEAKQRLILQTMLNRSGDWPKHLEVPLVSLLDSGFDGAVSLDLAGAELLQVKQAGLRSESDEDLARSRTRFYQYELSKGGRFPRLVLSSRPKAEEKHDREVCDRADFTTLVDPEGRMVHQFRFRVWNWRKSSLPLVLPADTQQILGARVDGRWLGQVPQQHVDGIQVMLTVPPAGNVHHFEIIYTSAAPGWTWPGWAGLEAPTPKLPLPPLVLQRKWRLPVGVEPLESSFICITDIHKEGPVLSRIRQAWHAGDPWLARLGLSIAEDWVRPQRQLMANADVTVRGKLAKDWLLAEALQILAVDSLADLATLVLDAEALKAAGLSPTAVIAGGKKSAEGAPFWESAGLVYVPCSGAPLLTTKVKLESWNVLSPKTSFADSIGPAVTEAALYGQDRSSRFRTLDHWLRSGEEDAGSFPKASEYDFGWSEWQPTRGQPHPDRMVVVQRRTVNRTGLVLAVVGTILAWRLRGRLSRSWFYRLLVVWLTVGGIALLWAPTVFSSALAWISLPPLLFIVVGYVRWLIRAATGRTESIARPAPTVAALLVLLTPAMFHQAATSGGPKIPVVLLIPGADGEPQTALVQPDLLKKLDEIAGRGTSFLNRAVLTRARYQGTIKGSTVEFQAELDCFNFADKSTLVIPLDGVDLLDGKAFLNGQPVFPVALQGTQAGYSLPLTEKGLQKLTLGFSIRAAGTGPNKELRFSIPRLAQSQVELTFPKNVQDIQASNAQGDQRLIAKGDSQTLRAQIGRENAVQVRWRSGSQAAPAPEVQVRELYLWDLRPPAPLLNAILDYSVKKGMLPGVSLVLPEGVVVRTVEVSPESSENSKIAEGLQPRLKSWRVLEKNGQRTLDIDFHNPVGGGVQIRLGLIPRLSLAPGNIALALPFPLQVKQPDGFLEGLLGYRLADLEAQQNPQNLGVIGISPEVFSKAWRVADPRSGVVSTRAFSFRRNAPKAALGLTLAAPGTQASQEITWKVGPEYADWTLSCELVGSAENLMLIEWQIPSSVVLEEVSGPDVRHWSRAAAVLQVWLSGPQKKTNLKLAGWARNSQPLAGGKGRFDLPALMLKNQTSVTTSIRVTPLPGLTMQILNLQNLVRPGKDEAGAFSLVTQKQPPANYGGSFLLAVAPAQPEVGILTVARIHNQAVDFTSHLDCRLPPGELNQLTVKVDRWSGDDINLEVLELAARVAHQKHKEGHSWTIFLPPGIPQEFSCRLSGRRELQGSVTLPDVRVPLARETGRFLALVGPTPRGEPIRGLAPLQDIQSRLARWPLEAKRILQEGTAWQITAQDWNLQIKPRLAPFAVGIQILHAEQEAMVGEDGHWVHQAAFLIFVKSRTEVHLTLPHGARLSAMALDEQPVSPRQRAEADVFWLPLEGAPGPHWLRLTWQFPKDESLTRPNLAGPSIQGIPQTALQGTVFIPAGFDVDGATPSADLMILRAKAQLELSKLLGEIETAKTKTPLAVDQKLFEAQKHLAWYCRQAEIQTTRSGLPAQTLHDLRRQNVLLMAKLDKEKIRLQAEKEAVLPDGAGGHSILALPLEGRPVSWRSEGPNPPRVILIPRSEQATHRALVASEVLLLILVGLGILTCLPRALAWLHYLWPEQLLLLAWVGWSFFEASAIGLALVVVGVSARLILAATWLQRLVHRTTPAAPGSGLHSAG